MKGKIFELKKIVAERHLDDNKHVNNLEYLRWAQEISVLHWSSASNNIDQEHVMWVVSRQEINYFKELFLNDDVLIQTYISEVVKHKCTRVIKMFRKQELVAEVMIHWILLDKKNKKPKRIPLEWESLFFE